jgi:hypothetical protein
MDEIAVGYSMSFRLGHRKLAVLQLRSRRIDRPNNKEKTARLHYFDTEVGSFNAIIPCSAELVNTRHLIPCAEKKSG